MGVSHLDEMNKALLLKWWWKLAASLNKKVCQILNQNYRSRSREEGAERRISKNGSQFSKELQEVKEVFNAGTSYILGDGNLIRFWKDKWIHNVQLRYVTTKLYEYSNKKEGSIKEHF